MGERKLETVVLGLNDDGQLLLKAASQIGAIRIQAIADKDAGTAEKLAAEHECAAYDDYRQLITAVDARLGEDEQRCLLVGARIHSCAEYVRMAIKKGFNVLKCAPAARDFEEAAELVRLAEEEDVKFGVANPGRFAGSYAGLRAFLEQGRVEQVFLIAAFCSFAGESPGKWQSDPKLAGGGVLLHKCYKIIDQIMCNFPIPQQVYSLTTNQALDKQQRLSLTEDTAVVAMKFSDTLVGNLLASSRVGFSPSREFVKVYGKDKILVVNDTHLTLSDAQGQVSEEFEYDNDALGCMKEVLENFAAGVLLPDEHEVYSSGRENLKNMAVIESAYLSARTGMPEEPGRILQMGQFEATDVEADFK